jgi:hypothetical protein
MRTIKRSDKSYESEKSEVISFLISGIMHEINNPSNLISLDADIFKKALNDMFVYLDKFRGDENFKLCNMPYDEFKKNAYDAIKGMKESSLRIAKIAKSLKEYLSSDEAGSSLPSDINSALNGALVITENFIRRKTDDFVFSLGDGIPPSLMPLQKLEEICIYLILHALLEVKSRDFAMRMETYFSGDAVYLEIRILKIRNNNPGCRKSSLSESTLSAAYGIVGEYGGELTLTEVKQDEKILILKIPALY